jgi:hypothetical protein
LIDKYNRDPIGPGMYKSIPPKKTGGIYRFAHLDRGLLSHKKDNSPNPFSYNTDLTMVLDSQHRREKGGAKSTAHRVLDMTRLASNHIKLLEKGLNV